MDAGVISRLLASAEAPLLPGAAALWLVLHLGWAIVLGSGMMLISGKLAARQRWIMSLLVVLWTLLPGTASPAFWLGLAFQSPSFMSLVLCLGWLLHGVVRRQRTADLLPHWDRRALKVLLATGIALGWLLLLDTMALFPFSLYAWGFGASAFAVVLAVAALLWLIRGSVASALPLAVLALFALSRLPTGNVWDALLDPWLWLVLQIGWLVSAARRLSKARRLSPTTRVGTASVADTRRFPN